MKASRFWAIWLLAFLIASATMIRAIAPQGLVSNDAKVSSESVQP